MLWFDKISTKNVSNWKIRETAIKSRKLCESREKCDYRDVKNCEFKKIVIFAILKTEFRNFRENAKFRKNVIFIMLKSVKF